MLRSGHGNQHSPSSLLTPELATNTLRALKRQKEHWAVAEDEQLPTQTILCVSFTSLLNHRVLWGEKLEDAVRKKCIIHSSDHPWTYKAVHRPPSECNQVILGPWKCYCGDLAQLLCPTVLGISKSSLRNGCERKQPQCNSSSLLSFFLFNLNPRGGLWK